MKSHLVFICILLINLSGNTYAQPCPEDPTEKKGVLIKSTDTGLEGFLVHPVTIKNKKQISTVLDSIANLFIECNPQPLGSEAYWFKDLRTENDSITSPDPSFTNYRYSSLYFPYLCSDRKIIKAHETDTWVFVGVNDFFHSGHMLQHEFNNALGEKLFTLPPQRGTLGGYPVFEPTPKGEEDSPWLLFYSVLIHHPGKLPYVPVTKKEFFDLSKRLIEIKEKETKNSVDIKNATPDEIKAHGEDWYLEQMERVDKQFKGINENLAQLEKLYEKEWNQPAILRSWDCGIRDIEIADPTQKKFFTTANRGYHLVRANPDYMDQTQEKWKPQFMWMQWQKPVAYKNALELDRVMREQFDFTELGKLLTK